ncbi:DNA-binding transcriptional regulator, LysR family [Rhizobiales bacterium GAS188]|nr:DNA-binding transcriptional regulator, LysR family [Rhizobiales bacterium GAS188]
MNLIDPELLRTLIAFVDSGSLMRAAAIVGRSPSAVTAQMQRLEEVVGEEILSASGRGRVLTPFGEDLVIQARRIVAAHREAWLNLKGARADGRVSLGATQDFAESDLPDLIGQFARTHPRVRLDLRIGRTAALTQDYLTGQIDILIAMRIASAPDEIAVLREPMLWLASPAWSGAAADELPLALLDPPCGFRDAALHALGEARRPYRIAATSPSLTGLRAALRAGITVTMRTTRWIGQGVGQAPESLGLPSVADAEFSLRLRPQAAAAATDLAHLMAEGLTARMGAQA